MGKDKKNNSFNYFITLKGSSTSVLVSASKACPGKQHLFALHQSKLVAWSQALKT